MGQDIVLCTFGPPTERKRMWVIKFEDAEKGEMHFHDEDEAIGMFRRCSVSWTCTLFVTAEMAAEVGFEPTHAGVKGPRLKPLGDSAIQNWFRLPLALRQRWWRETDYGLLAPSADLAAAMGLVPPGGIEPPSPP